MGLSIVKNVQINIMNKTHRITIRITEQRRTEFEQEAKEFGITLSELLRRKLDEES